MLKPLKASDVTEAGAYEWYDESGMRHVGFLFAERRGISGSFISEDGATRAVTLKFVDGGFCAGSFFGPIPPAHKL